MGRAHAGACRWILGLLASLQVGAAVGQTPADIQVLDPTVADATASEVTSGSLDSHFTSSSFREQASRGEAFWLRIESHDRLTNVIPVLIVHAGTLHKIRVYAAGAGTGPSLISVAHAPDFAGARDNAYLLPGGNGSVYVRVEPPGPGHGAPRFFVSTMDRFLAD
ncbi:MAG: hypothetical protein JO042_09615, partial [Sinobacteraceae bacterium]|nr:hypothetical protein [Nevskiaceae bacterium]